MKRFYFFFFLLLFIGFENNIFSQPANNTCATAQSVTPNGSCVSGTTVNATDTWSGTVGCQSGSPNNHPEVWYSFVSTGTSYAGTVTGSGSWAGNVEFTLVQGTCGGGFTVVGSSCGASPLNVNISGLTSGTTYYFTISNTASGTTGPFSVCSSTPSTSCTGNQNCSTPQTITYTTGVQTCVTGCNTGTISGPNFAGNNCYDFPNSTVWYQVTTGASSATMNISVTSASLSDPYFTVFTTPNCLTYTTINCVQGSGGTVSGTTNVTTNTTYLIAVSDQTADQGSFNICVTVNNDNSACNTNDQLSVTATSMGSPLSGPYQPGEQVTFCYTITNYLATNCNYLAGIVPTFGDCWDPVSFNAQGQPVNITTPLATAGTIQNNPPFYFPACAGQPAGTWTWFTAGAVDYNNITGSLPPNTPLGAGWFFLSSYDPLTGNCAPDPTDPDNSYGDNNYPTCNSSLDWQVCFRLQARAAIACTNGQTDCSVSIKTYADGEIGIWNNVGCTADLPAVFPATLVCCSPPVVSASNGGPYCVGGTINLSATGGTGYSWSGPGGFTSSVQNPIRSGATTAMAGTYTVTVTDAAGCLNTATTSVVVNAAPTTAPSASPTAICNGGNTTLNANATAGSGSISGYTWSSGLGNVASGSVSPTSTTTYTVAVTNSNTCSATGTVTVTVNALPTVAPSASPATICNGQSTTLAANATAGSGSISTYTWSSGLGNVASGSVSPTSNTTYTITVTNSNSCSVTGNVSVTVNARPTVAPTANPTAICNGGSTTLNANASAGSGSISSYVWSSGLGNVANGTVSPALTTTYTVTVTNSNTCSATGTVTVTVNANPTVAPAASPAVICGGGSTTLSANATAGSGSISGYVWSSGLGNVASGSVSPVSNTTYTVTVTNSNTCTATGTISVTVSANPTVAPSAAPATICSGQNTTLSANATAGSGSISSYAWSSGLGNVASGSVLPTSNTTYTVTVTNSNTCSATGSVLVIVNARPIVSPTATPAVICTGQSATLNANAVAGSGTISGYAWSSGLGNVASGNVSPTSTTTYTVTVTNSNTCSLTGTVTVTVNANPTVAPTAAPAVICNGGNTTLTANAIAGSGSILSYVWSSGLGNVASGVVSPTSNTNYTVTVQNSNGCSVSGSVSVSVNARPTVAPTASPIAICNGASTTLAANATAGSGTISSYTWSSGLGNVASGSVYPTSTTTYTVTVTNSNTCSATGTVTVTVNANPTVAPTATPAIICNGQNTTLSANATAGSGTISGYAWSSGLGNVASGTVSPASTTTYTVTVTNSNTCSATGTVTVTVNANPTVAPTATPAIVCNGQNTTLSANATAGSGSISSYSWSSGLGNVATGSVSPTTNTTYTVTVTNSNTCSATGSVSVMVNTRPTVAPTASPTVICNGGSTTLNANAAAGSGSISSYAWSSGLGNVATGTVSPTSTTTYTVTVTNSNTCSATGAVTITVNANPIVAPSASPAIICNGQSTTLSANATAGSGSISSYTWSGGLGNVASGVASLVSTTTYTVTVTNSNTCSATGTVTVTVNANPTVAPTASPGTICTGGSSTLAANALAGSGTISNYLWSSGLGNVASGTVSPTSTTTYTVTVTNSNSCSATGSITITLSASLVASISPTTVAICTGSSATLTASGGTNFNWNNSAISQSITVSPTSTTSYTVTVSDITTCTATASRTVVVNPLPLVSISPSSVTLCAGQSTTFTATGGTGFAWSNSATSSSINVSPSVTTAYSVTVTDNNTCTASATSTVNVVPAMNATATATNVSCNGGNNGSVNLSVSGGQAPISFLWSNSSTSQNLSLLTANTYTVTLTDNAGCSITSSAIVSQPSLLSVSEVHLNILCNGGNNASITTTTTGGTTPNSYLWNDGNTNANRTNLTAGNYSVTVTDANLCTASVSATITQPAVLSVSETHTNVSCNGGNNGSITVTPSGGTTAYSYSWNDGNVNQNRTNLGAGNYSVTVTDANFCSVSASISLTQPALLSISETHSNVLCNGGSTGSITTTTSGGTTPYSYLWSGGNTNANRTNLTSGNYSVTVTDANFCTASVSAAITQPAVLSVSETHVNILCNGGNNGSITTTTSGGTTGYSYLWNDGNTNANRTNLLAGTYSLTVSDANLCTASVSTSLTQPSLLSVSETHTNIQCNGSNTGSITLSVTGGVIPYSFTWNDGNTNQNRVGLSAGNYSVTVADNNSCPASTSVIITQPIALGISETHADIACGGATPGSIAVSTYGGIFPYTYLWNDGVTSGNRTGLTTAGVYSVTVTDSNSCTSTLSITINAGSGLNITETHANVSCNGGSDATINTSVNGGTLPYSFNWNDGNTNQNRTNLGTGNYSVIVSDNNSCSASISVSITQPAVLNVSQVQSNVLCNGANTGSITLTVNGGTTPYSYNWNDGNTNQDRTNLFSGNYLVTVIDNNACSSSLSVSITQPAAILISETHDDIACGGATPGSITVSTSGGIFPYTYLWNDGVTSGNRTGLTTAGVYSVTITDNNSCTSVLSVIINAGSGLNITETHANVSCNGGSDATINTSVNGGTLPYSFIWNDGNANQNRTNLGTGNYSVTVSDNNSCSASIAVNITEPPVFSVSVIRNNVVCNGGNTGSITISPSGGTSPYSYSWNDGATSQNRSFVSAGTYVLTVSDNNNCTFSVSMQITEPNPLSVVETHSDVLCNGGNTGSVNLTTNGGVSPYTYSWNDGNANPNRTGLTASNYSVTVSDNNLCSAALSVAVMEPSVLSVTELHADVLCNGAATGSINLISSGGILPHQFVWNDGNTNQNRVNLAAGSYTVTLTDNNSCSVSGSIVVTEPAALLVSETRTNILCNGNNTGAITITASGGTSPLSFLWNDGNTNQNRANLVASTYIVTVSDTNSCSSSVSVSITEPAALSVTETHSDVGCSGGNTASIDVTPVGGVAPYGFAWNDGITSEDRTNIPQGNYSVIVTDNNSCSTSVSVVIASASGIVMNETHANVSCFAGGDGSITVSVTGGSPPYSYLWNDGNINQNRSGISSGAYTLSVTDNNSCVASISVSITQPAALSLLVSPVNVLCNGDVTGSISVTTSGGTTPYGFLWNDAATTEDRSNISAGNYTLTVSDNNSCTSAVTVSITEPTPLSVSETHIDVACGNGSNGSIDVSVSGATPGYNFIWNDGLTGEDRINLAAGSYAVTVSDLNSCSSSVAVSITQPTSLAISEAHTNVLCNSGSDGSIDITITGGSSPYTYLWNDGDTNEDRQNLTATSYSVTVTDNNLCSASASVTLTHPQVLTFTETHTHVLCNDGNTGTITTVAGGGTTPYSFIWNDGNANQNRNNLVTGIYSVTLTDNNSCSASLSVVITEPSPFTVTEIHTDATCFGVSTGSIDVSVSGATAPYSYLWNDAVTSQDRNNISSGNYAVTISDNNLCTSSLSINITQPAVVSVAETHTHVLCNGGNGASIDITASGGNPAFSYLWNDAVTTEDRTSLSAGTYSVTANDINQCSVSLSIVITEPAALAISEIHTHESCAGYTDASISVTVTGGSPAYSFIWNDGVTSPNRINIPAGAYSVTVSDNNSCTGSTSVIITEPVGMTVTPVVNNPTCPSNGNDGSIVISVSGSTPPYQFIWSDGSGFSSNTSLGEGNYSVSISDANGCTAGNNFVLAYQFGFTVDASPSVTISLGDEAQLGYTLSGSAGVYSSIWSPPYALSCVACEVPVSSPAVTTHYTVTVTNEAGCTASDTTTVYVNTLHDVFVPNVFTPNGDGNNDVFQVYGKLKALQYLEIQVFNRWGEKVFESSDHRFAWDGSYKGVLQNPQVFIWQLKLTWLDGQRDEIRKGSLTLVR